MIRDDRERYDPKRDFFARSAQQQETERIDEGGWQAALQERKAGNAGAERLQRDIAAQIEAGAGKGPSAVEFDDNDLDWS